MTMFHSYVSLPEGNNMDSSWFHFFKSVAAQVGVPSGNHALLEIMYMYIYIYICAHIYIIDIITFMIIYIYIDRY